jgi:triosephosphate isomerase (TIM)
MKEIYVNLKRFDVPKKWGGLCPDSEPISWIRKVIEETVELEMGSHHNLKLVYLLPEGLIPSANQALLSYPETDRSMLSIGCQGVHWDDITPGGNFGAFTTVVPATAAKVLGSTWAIIGHSEERRFKYQVIKAYAPDMEKDINQVSAASRAIDSLINREVKAGLSAGLNVLLCVGESAEERGEGNFEEQKPRIESVLRDQLLSDLSGIDDVIGDKKVEIGYEPIWAIGPGKVPPGKEYISFVSAFIKKVIGDNFGRDFTVVYGGG